MNKTLLFSSKQIISALKRAGFELKRKTKGSHQALARERENGRNDIAIVVLGKKEVPKSTLLSILDQANITYEEFLELAKVKRKRK